MKEHTACGRRIAFPGMGTGVGGISPNAAAKLMIKVAKEFDDKFDRILFIDINEKMVHAFRTV